MAQDKNGFLLYKDLIHSVRKLPKEKAGELFLHILEYVNDEDPQTDDLLIELAFEPIKQSLKRDLKKYEKVRQRNSANARKRWDKENATVCDRMPPHTKNADSDSVSDSVSDILLEKETKGEILTHDTGSKIPETETSKKVAEKKVSFRPPDPAEVQTYCMERQNGINATEFCDFYQSKGWMIGKNKMKDWRAAVRTWEKSRKQNGNNQTRQPTTGKTSARQFITRDFAKRTSGNSESGNFTIDVEAIE